MKPNQIGKRNSKTKHIRIFKQSKSKTVRLTAKIKQAVTVTLALALAMVLCQSARALELDSLWAARDAAQNAPDAEAALEIYRWALERLESHPRDFENANVVMDIAGLAGQTDGFSRLCAVKSDDTDPVVAGSASYFLVDTIRNNGDAKTSEIYYRKALALGNDCPSQKYNDSASHLASLLRDRGDREEALAALVPVITRITSTPPDWVSRRIIELQAPEDVLEECAANFHRRMSAPPRDMNDFVSRAERVMPQLVDFLLASGKTEEALRECRALLFVSHVDNYPRAVELTARALKHADGNLSRVNDFLVFQGADVSAGAPEMPNPLFNLQTSAVNFPTDPVRAKAFADVTSAPAPAGWNRWLARSAY